MFSQQQIEGLTDNPDFHKFAVFILDSLGDAPFPDYKKIDLMRIPSLVPHIWVLDFEEIKTKGCRFVFSGTEVDYHYNRNITGEYLEKLYTGNDYEKLIEKGYRSVHTEKKAYYTHRSVHFNDGYVEKYRHIEAMMVPCSSDGEHINYGLGLAYYNITGEPTEAVYSLL